MASVFFISPAGVSRQVEVPLGTSLMEAAVKADVRGIEAECGGCLTCATCHVYVDTSGREVAPPSDEEVQMLAFVAAERRPDSRLSCQLVMTEALEGLTVRVPERQF